MYDVAIVGAGPAGSMLARLIGQRYRVLLIERRPLDGPEKPSLGKCCGGRLADRLRSASRSPTVRGHLTSDIPARWDGGRRWGPVRLGA